MTDQESINYWERGFELYKQEPELLMIELWRRVSDMARDDQFEFVGGYATARRQRDDYLKESKLIDDDEEPWSHAEADTGGN